MLEKRYPKEVLLKDGSEIILKTPDFHDRDALHQFYCGLSPKDGIVHLAVYTFVIPGMVAAFLAAMTRNPPVLQTNLDSRFRGNDGRRGAAQTGSSQINPSFRAGPPAVGRA